MVTLKIKIALQNKYIIIVKTVWSIDSIKKFIQPDFSNIVNLDH